MKIGTEIQIEPATAADTAAIAELLRAAELPSDDFAPHVGTFLVARRGRAVVGVVGAEVAGADALLRSLVVAASERGAGLGGRLVDALERAAAEWGVERWWLLTTTAQAFFAARGFSMVERASAPPAMQRTKQFSGGCCCSAVCLTRARKGPVA